MTDINWDEVEHSQRGRRRPRRSYLIRMCPFCSQTISESAYSGRGGNWKKHARACEKRRGEGSR